MDPLFPLTLEAAPQQADTDFVRSQLDAFNRRHSTPDNHCPLSILVRESKAQIVAGLLGASCWGWLVIEILWVAKALRGQGYGSRYLLMLFAFLAGLFPITITRWITGWLRSLLELDGRQSLPLTEINGIDPETATYLNDKGIWTIVELEAGEPKVLAARLHLDPELVTYWQSQASLLVELGDADTVKHFRRLGINEWSDLAILDQITVDDLTIHDLLQAPKAKDISPVLIQVLKAKARNMQEKKGSP